MALLVFSKDDKTAFQVRLGAHTTKIGRSGTCDVVLSDSDVSREHAAIYSSEGQYLLKKTGKGSLRIQGQEIDQHSLRQGDTIQLGPWEIKFIQDGIPDEELEVTQVSETQGGRTQAVAASSGGMLMEEFQIQVLRPNHAVQNLNFSQSSLSVGADPKNDLVIKDPFVSSRHLKLVQEGGQVWIYDLGSTNGTFLGDVKVREAQWDGSQAIRLGQTQIQLLSQGSVEPVQPIPTDRFCGMIGESAPMQKLYGMIHQVGPTEAMVLVLGESGSGKELVARAVHQLSARADKPFIPLNCGAISKELIESELFGHEKGAFTGAAKQHEGAFGQAKGGTLFLDEVGELPLDLQPKLVRVLENKTYRRVGGSEELRAEVRVVAATHRNLAKLVQEKKFREDLFFRLFVLPIPVPALREHAEDIPLLAQNFLKEFCPPGQNKRLSQTAASKLESYTFPGNIREFRNVMMRAVLLSQGEEIQEEEIIFPEGVGGEETAPQENFKDIETLEAMERKMVEKALKHHKWNKAKAAEALGIAKSTLFSKIKLYGLESPEKKS
ncbi:MAG: sigma 54-interacting transcriptional regulator [bacterium]|nr:sigma 54-interacting transcriptional regulator [bacterium]